MLLPFRVRQVLLVLVMLVQRCQLQSLKLNKDSYPQTGTASLPGISLGKEHKDSTAASGAQRWRAAVRRSFVKYSAWLCTVVLYGQWRAASGSPVSVRFRIEFSVHRWSAPSSIPSSFLCLLGDHLSLHFKELDRLYIYIYAR